MILKNIKYSSAVFIGSIALVFQVIAGILQVVINAAVPGYFSQLGVAIEPVQTIIIGPILVAILSYLISLLGIWVYNFIARKYPIAWEISK